MLGRIEVLFDIAGFINIGLFIIIVIFQFYIYKAIKENKAVVSLFYMKVDNVFARIVKLEKLFNGDDWE